MLNQHPITPPPKVVDRLFMIEGSEEDRIIAAYKAGADQELEACCTAIDEVPGGWADSRHLRHVRRPKPPNLKEQALALLDDASDRLDAVHENTIRRALEALPE